MFEVLEAVPHFEGKLEFMNVELAPAFEWVAVFRYQGGSYREATGQFESFLRSRRAHYELWLRLVESGDNLGSDSQRLVRANRAEFVTIIERYIQRIDELLGKRAA